MPPHPRTPVLVGVGVVQQREDDPEKALEPVELMIAALERAAEDAGSRELLARADSVRAPRGFWSYPDPCRIVAERFGAQARTELTDVGVLQTTLFGGAAADIAAGRHDIVLVTGGEAKYRSVRAAMAGLEESYTAQPGVEPDLLRKPTGDILSRLEMLAGIAMPVGQYAMIENALRHVDGESIDDHLQRVAELWAGASRIAAANPDAWSREVVSADEVRSVGGGNRMIAFPYTKLHNSNWNVDQAAGLVFCSLETAQTLGIPSERWVFPQAVAENNFMHPLTGRRALHRSPGYQKTGARVFERIGREGAAVDHLELYSCFPAAVRVQARELGIPEDRPFTVTGGMAYAGGPLNNFVLQALARMTGVLRADPGSMGLVNAVSGMITKQGVTAWSTEPPPDGFHYDDLSEETRDALETVEVVGDAHGPGTLVTYTVLYQGDAPERAVLLCDLPDGRRALVVSQDIELALAMTREEFCGRTVRLAGPGKVEVD